MADDPSTYHGQQQQEQQSHHQHHNHREIEDSLLDDGTLTGSTPRPPATKSQMQFANFGSPYENLRREMKGEEDNGGQGGEDHTAGSDLFAEDPDDETTQQLRQDRLPDMSMTEHDDSSLMLDAAATPVQGGGGTRTNLFGTANKNNNNKDPLLHRLLDKNYRIQATPHKGGARTPNKDAAAAAAAGGGETDHTRRALWQDSPQSSPEMAAPTLRTNLYSAMSPLKGQRGRPAAAAGAGPTGEAPRTPGVSVQTPAKKRDVFAEYRSGGGGDSTGKGKGLAKYDNDEITWDSDDEDDGMFGGMSPPKTIQFALPPSKLMQTPGKSAVTLLTPT